MRARARSYVEAFEARTDDFEVIYASKALPVTAAYRVLAEEGLSVDVASGGELYLALKAGVPPQRIFMHGNNKTEAELQLRVRLADRLYRAGLLRGDRACRSGCWSRSQEVLIRVTPGIKPSTHSYIQTGQLDSKFGFGLEDGLAAEAVRRVRGSSGSSWSGSTPTSGPRSSSSSRTRGRSGCSPTSSTSTAGC